MWTRGWLLAGAYLNDTYASISGPQLGLKGMLFLGRSHMKLQRHYYYNTRESVAMNYDYLCVCACVALPNYHVHPSHPNRIQGAREKRSEIRRIILLATQTKINA